jgi:proliferating cell nuclear antigen PCNA
MKFTIIDKKKKENFVSLFSVLKNCSSLINITFNSQIMHIQGMDKAHICLFDVKIHKNWFTSYDIVETIKVCFDSNFFYSIISTKSDNQDLIIFLSDDNLDILNIVFDSKEVKKGEFKKTFKMNLTEYEYEEMNIPIVEYDAEFTLSSKLISDMFNQLNNFGDDIIIYCSEESVSLTTNGVITVTFISPNGSMVIPSTLTVNGTAASIKWQGGTTPSQSSNQIQLVVFSIITLIVTKNSSVKDFMNYFSVGGDSDINYKSGGILITLSTALMVVNYLLYAFLA